MRIECLPFVALLMGCQAHVSANGARGEVRFSFDRPVRPRTIKVFEIANMQRGREVCTLKPVFRDSQPEATPVDSWQYGKPIEESYQSVACEPLVRDRRYGIMVYLPGRREIVTDFQIQNDGSVVNLDIRSQ